MILLSLVRCTLKCGYVASEIVDTFHITEEFDFD